MKGCSHGQSLNLGQTRRLPPLVVEERADDRRRYRLTNAITQNLFAQQKLTHEAAKYQDQPKDGQQCSGCVQFVAPASCKVVADPISASGWCQLFTAKPA